MKNYHGLISEAFKQLLRIFSLKYTTPTMVASIHPINLSIHVKTAGIVNITPPKETMHTRPCMLAGVSIILK